MNAKIQDIDFYINSLRENYPTEQLYKITKISKNNGGQIYPDYWVIGALIPEYYKAKGRIRVWRLANSENPEGKLGEFTSSEILTIEHHEGYDLVHTFNSVYRVEKI